MHTLVRAGLGDEESRWVGGCRGGSTKSGVWITWASAGSRSPAANAQARPCVYIWRMESSAETKSGLTRHIYSRSVISSRYLKLPGRESNTIRVPELSVLSWPFEFPHKGTNKKLGLLVIPTIPCGMTVPRFGF